ncbi:Target of rapamycin complex 1 subunit kog1 [Malassezia cuniculi]|uniref:Target of rapamycin complex 1 subunit kog1 n=1 Tax=Malassezia cuniculi TaxID=948313 RepID=A0AAF0END7_9BASI|nr:Target of rapamycin complex 1 subunit kog1 [Malassezia cuniculi]
MEYRAAPARVGESPQPPAAGDAVSAAVSDAASDSGDSSPEVLGEGPRHGALLLPKAEDWALLESPYMTHWSNKRHVTNGDPRARRESDKPDWRMRERLRTVAAALVMCLNIGVDPPDVSKTNPSSKLICWMDPESLEPSKALAAIGRNLQVQFETLSMKTRYKQYLDPIVEDTKRFCNNLRRTAKDERVLFYYNGFGVPKPTPGGEIWVFNRAYTQYIPLTLYDLQTWLGSPCIYVWDASASGNIVNTFKRISQSNYEEAAKAAAAKGRTIPPLSPDGIVIDANGEPQFPLRESIHLAACAADEILPMNPDLPADLFTCCLTSPIEIALRWFVLQNPLPSSLNVEMVMNIPGRLQDRRTPLGELNWILTAVTDTIAWTVLPRAIFRRFFRDDLMVAALLRNFLLAERIMRCYHCTPTSYPKLPPTYNHPLWDSWDLAVDQCLAQLPTLLAKEQARVDAAAGGPPVPQHLAEFEYTHSTFFSEQLKAFEVWLSQGDVSRRSGRRRVARSMRGDTEADHDEYDDDDEVRLEHDPPMQLPIVLQVLLSQVHRLRALILLSQFLDLGPWAVNLALSIGIFPYVLKLLQSPAADLKPVLIYIWARILAVDRSCQVDLLRDNGYVYFANVLSPFAGSGGTWAPSAALPLPNISEHRAMCAFILSVFCQDFPAGQEACLETDAMEACLEHLEDDDYLLRQWSALCLAHLWDMNDVGKARAIAMDAHGKLCCLLSDASPEVRAAMLYALGVLIGASGSAADAEARAPRAVSIGTGSLTGLAPAKQRSLEIGIGVAVLSSGSDCSPLVRKELVVVLSTLVLNYQGFFALAAYMYYAREREHSAAIDENDTLGDMRMRNEREEQLLSGVFSQVLEAEDLSSEDIANVPAILAIYVMLLDLAADAHPEVRNLACTVIDHITALLFEAGALAARGSALAHLDRTTLSHRSVINTRVGVREPQAEPHSPSAPRISMSSIARTVMSLKPKSSPADTPHMSGSFVLATPMNEREDYLPPYAPGSQGAPPSAETPDKTSTVAQLQRILESPAASANTITQVLAGLVAADLRRLRQRSAGDDEDGDEALAADARPDVPANARLATALPLRSRLLAWCSEYYTEPQMRAAEADEPGSRQYNRQTWTQQRCARQISEAAEQAVNADRERWTQRLGAIHTSAPPTLFAFREYDTHLVVASGEDTVSVYDWEERRLLSSFSNGNRYGSRITSLAFVNEEVDALLLTGSADGDVRIYRRYARAPSSTRQRGPELVSAFRALPDLVRSKYPSGLIVDWQQVGGRLVAAGDAQYIRVWDAHRELCIADLPTHTQSCATSLACDRTVGHLIMAGFGDGSIGVYDQRNPPASSLVRLWEEHDSWVQQVHLQRFGDRELLSASMSGDVRLWDIRASTSISSTNISMSLRAPFSAAAVHDRIPVFASVSAPYLAGSTYAQSVQMARLEDLAPLGHSIQRTLHNPLVHSQTYRHRDHDRMEPPSPYSPATGMVALHPHYPVLAYGGPDTTIELMRHPQR